VSDLLAIRDKIVPEDIEDLDEDLNEDAALEDAGDLDDSAAPDDQSRITERDT